MALTTLIVEIGNPATPDVTEQLELLVDSGAMHSVAPQQVLQRLGIRPLVTDQFRLADGSRIARKKGVAFYKYGNRVGGADVIFGEADDCHLLGTLTLGALGLALDPLRRELKPLPLVL